MDEFVAKRCRNGERTAINNSAHRSRLKGGNMTNGTPYLIEMGGPGLGVRGGCQNRVSWRGFRGPEETGERVDSLMPGRAMAVLRVRNGIALGDKFIREDAVGDPQVTEISQRSECKQARHTAFPTKTTYRKRDLAAIEHRGDAEFACDVAVRLCRLASRNDHECSIRNRFYNPSPRPLSAIRELRMGSLSPVSGNLICASEHIDRAERKPDC